MPRTARNLTLVPAYAFPAQMRAERARRGLTQVDVANELGVGSQTVSQWELGKKKPQVRHTAKLIEFLGLTSRTELQVLLGLPIDPRDEEHTGSVSPIRQDEAARSKRLTVADHGAAAVDRAEPASADADVPTHGIERPAQIDTADYVLRAIADYVSKAGDRELSEREMSFLEGLRLPRPGRP